MIFFLFFFAFFFLGNNVVGCFTFGAGVRCLLFCCLLCELGTIPPPQGGLLAVPCGQGIPPSQTPHIDTSGMYFTLELHVLYNIVVILSFFLSFPSLKDNFSCLM